MNTPASEREGDARPAETTTKISGVIVDLGTRSGKQVERLKQGRGKLVAEVFDCIDDLRKEGQVPASAEPVIVVVERESDCLF